eukprot:TRINITY_DN2537_c0_g1_i4.p1 TRINITY_DN2537_c0_g1~~TRINITY_DN2537_c0_g1_i4.p1  ORF type:complete len:107 (-),score=18.24 TRINITY_DN2537_c0_g1_i4:37-357(-)
MGNDLLKLMKSPGAEADIKVCFDSYDKDKSGSLDKKELRKFAKDCYDIGCKMAKKMAKELGMPSIPLPPFNESMAEDALKKLDADGDGKVTYEEFKAGLHEMEYLY